MGIFRKRMIRYPLLYLSILSVITAALLCVINIWIGLVYSVVAGALLYYGWIVEKMMYVETEKHIESLSFRMKKVGEEAFLHMPVGILLIDDEYKIEWANPFMLSATKAENLIGESIFELSGGLVSVAKPEELRQTTVTIGERKYRVYSKPEEKLLYFFDVTEQLEIQTQYFADRTVIAILFIDNYDEITQPMDDQMRGITNSTITSIINEWAAQSESAS